MGATTRRRHEREHGRPTSVDGGNIETIAAFTHAPTLLNTLWTAIVFFARLWMSARDSSACCRAASACCRKLSAWRRAASTRARAASACERACAC